MLVVFPSVGLYECGRNQAVRSTGRKVPVPDIDRGPRPRATVPDCAISLMPNGARTASSACSLSGVPVASRVTVSGLTSTTRARKSSAVWSTWVRSARGARTLTSSSSRCTAAAESSSTILMISMSLFSCLVICSRGWLSASTTIVIRERSGFSVGPTASDLMLNPRRLNSAETRARTPDLFSTRTESVWRDMPRFLSMPTGTVTAPSQGLAASPRTMRSAPPGSRPGPARGGEEGVLLLHLSVAEDRAHVARGQDVVVAGAGGDHRPHLGVVADDEVDDHRGVVDRHGLLDHRVHVVLALAAQPDAAQRLGEQDEVGDAHRLRGAVGVPGVQLRVGVATLVEEGLPLPHHAQVSVVDHRDLDGDALDRAGGQLLVRHLEAAVTVDRPDGGLRAAVLGAHRRRNGVAHRAEAAAVEPGARLLVPDELGRPHLVLPHAGGVDRVGTGDRPEPLDDVLRG